MRKILVGRKLEEVGIFAGAVFMVSMFFFGVCVWGGWGVDIFCCGEFVLDGRWGRGIVDVLVGIWELMFCHF